MTTFKLESVYKSLIKKIQEIITEIRDEDVSQDLQYHAWDSRGAVTELPDTDLVGLVNWSYSENGGLPIIEGGLILSTLYDENLFKEVKILDILRDHCVKEDHYLQWPLLDDTGEEYGLLTITEFEVLPSGRSEVRSTRHIGIEFIKTSNIH